MKKLLLTGFALIAMTVQSQTWTTQDTQLQQGGYPLRWSVVDANTVWASAADGSGGGANLLNYTRTSNGGTTWTSGAINLGAGSFTISDLSAANATTAWVIAFLGTGGAGGGVWKTTNGGTTWTKQTFPSTGWNAGTSFPNVVYFWDENVGFAMGDPDSSNKYELYNTTNGGATWTRNPAGNSPTLSNEFAYTGMKATAGNTVWFGTDLGRVMKSNDRGVTWTASFTPIIDFGGVTTPGTSGQLTLKDANTAWVMDQDGLIFSTIDAAENWDIVDVLSGTVYSSDIIYVPGTTNTLISSGASTTSRGSSISLDGGKNWTDLIAASGDTDGIAGLGAYSTSAIWGGGFSDGATGGMSKLGALLATANPALGKNAVSVFPNPTKGQVNIESKSPVKSIILVDLNGRIVKTFENIKQLNLSGLEKGVYMLNVTLADGQKTSTKLVKE